MQTGPGRTTLPTDFNRPTERDVSTRLVVPALETAGWNLSRQVREEYPLTAGRIIVRGNMSARGNRRRADFVLFHGNNQPIAVIEAKSDRLSVGAGMQQALEYAAMLDVPFAFSTNGNGFLFHDRTNPTQLETELGMDEFPSPDALWSAYRKWKSISPEAERVIAQPYHQSNGDREPRYYQVTAINRAVEAVANGDERILLVMATGTGKTYTAFQIAWRLWKAGTKRRILFLADRNILIDQTKNNDFSPFGNVMTKIVNRQADKSYEVYLALYQAVSGSDPSQDIYKQFSKDFFDLIIVDECHRGSAVEDSAWREILLYFESATQIGLTATPRETKDVSSAEYFGKPLYTYSLKQGIEDGFLAPYKVVRYDLDRDLLGYRPEKGAVDKYGIEIEDKNYSLQDFDKTLIIEHRTRLVAEKVSEYLRSIGPMSKTIIFCETRDHADRMRSEMVRLNADRVLEDARYVVRITGDDDYGISELYNFTDPESAYPVVATTSRLLSTGVDIKTCKVIVLDRAISSLIEFKQIIGRGTRVDEGRGKTFFTIMDFRRVTELFADPDFDGEPVQIYDISEGDVLPHDEPSAEIAATPDLHGSNDRQPQSRQKFYVDGLSVEVVARRVQYLDATGALITETISSYASKRVVARFGDREQFSRQWSDADQKKILIDALEAEGVSFDALRDEIPNGHDYGIFDLLLHVSYGTPLVSRAERAKRVIASGYLEKYQEPARRVLEGLLSKYADQDVETIESPRVLQLRPFSDLGTPVEIVRDFFGGRNKYQIAIRDLESAIYQEA